ncbi:MAG: GGDEF domain-containing protein [Betaproteobacteria bacterium]|jgi:diguanylate cyclase (GGDEF)-like protein|nr:GGDEF domain-containing protein [Betaproteobacteria bacterium]MDH4293084.1 GGDEF domain-containing protein [Betaproteobacteria bacterium]MDH5342431.1 GGDEF domain-containing protein [Betaproteobacteria bacterium]
MIALLAKGIVFGSTLILISALIKVWQLVGQLPSGLLRTRWSAMMALIVLFMLGYLGYIGVFWGRHQVLLDLIVPSIFLLGACFVWLTGVLSLQTAMDVMRVSRLERETLTDPLTGIFNRRYLDRRLHEETAVARRYGRPLSVMLLDIDHFKRINDGYGHQIGDHVLSALVEVVAGVLRESDIFARYGGEEFMIIAPHTPQLRATDLAERLRKCIEAHQFKLTNERGEDLDIRLTVSIGVASFSDEIADMDKLVHAADENMYRAKHEGRNRVISGMA